MKTPLAKLKAMLTIKTKIGTSKVSQQDVADWLGCGIHNVASIESGRVKLTEANARIIERQTGASSLWLLGKRNSPYPITWAGTKFKQADFDRAQAALKSPKRIPVAANAALKRTIGKLTTILLQAAKLDQIDRYELKLESLFNDVLNSFPKDSSPVDLSNQIDFGYTDHKTPDFKPLFTEFQKQLMKASDH